MAKHGVCPWWLGYLLASPLRRLSQNPARILLPYLRPGMTVLEPGPGMGFFTLDMARMVGASGRVVAVDVQPRMIEALKRRARRAGLLDRIDARIVEAGSMALGGLDGSFDFVFACAVVHEVPSAARFFAEAARAMKSGAKLLLAEPAGHVENAEFSEQTAAAERSGLRLIERPPIARCHTALFEKD